MLEAVRLTEQVPPEWFLYQQEVFTYTYITFHTSLVPRPRPAFHQLLPILEAYWKCTGSVLESWAGPGNKATFIQFTGYNTVPP